jgi:hypothetical protein
MKKKTSPWANPMGISPRTMSDKELILLLYSACKKAVMVVSEMADIDSQTRAGWAHKDLSEAIEAAEKQYPDLE